METWSVFYGNDLAIGILGAVGLLSVVAVITTASSRVDKRERILREARRALEDQAAQKEIDDSLGYDTYSK
jgi:hypothetical protein